MPFIYSLKYIVEEETSVDNIWWKNETRKSSDNKPVSPEIWKELKIKGEEKAVNHQKAVYKKNDVSQEERHHF